MTTQSHQMTGSWQNVGTGTLTITPQGDGGFAQQQATDATADTLARNYGHSLIPGARTVIEAGSLAVWVKGRTGEIWTVTGPNAATGIDVSA
ncbi:hypothetical protein [Dinoroseobacter sp. S124A]|uniref:hypothetical protein n=1 Tax=Dinoroseobacter sp. S124A TaxID=3415128 RepID=UPI003C7B2BC1